jgi:putative membrane protein
LKYAFAATSILAVAGAVVSKLTGIRPPYWVGCALGFVAVVLAGVWVAFRMAQVSGWRRVRFGTILGLAWVSAAEICGLFTGYPFGDYRYTELWLPLIPLPQGHQFPVALPITWFVLGGAVALLIGSGRFAWIWGGILLALIDFALEPVLTGPVGFWRWSSGDPPALNYVGWFCVGAVLILLLRPTKEVSVQLRRDMAALLAIVLAGTLVIGVSHGEMRGLFALIPLAAVLLAFRITSKP